MNRRHDAENDDGGVLAITLHANSTTEMDKYKRLARRYRWSQLDARDSEGLSAHVSRGHFVSDSAFMDYKFNEFYGMNV